MIAIRNHVVNRQESSWLILRLHATLAHRCVTSVASAREQKANACAAGRQCGRYRAGRKSGARACYVPKRQRDLHASQAGETVPDALARADHAKSGSPPDPRDLDDFRSHPHNYKGVLEPPEAGSPSRRARSPAAPPASDPATSVRPEPLPSFIQSPQTDRSSTRRLG
jgi:hypothetical protein